MRLALVVVLAACAGAQAAPEPAPDPCGAYQMTMAGPMSRMMRSADVFEDAVERGPAATARAARDLAAALDHERTEFAALRTGRADLDRAHAHLVAAVGELSAVYRALAAGIENGRVDDALRARLGRAAAGFADAVRELQRVCPGQSRPGA